MVYVSLLAQGAAILLMIGIAWYDARHLKVRNSVVIAMLLLYLVAQGSLGFPTWTSDLLAGGVLFVTGFVMWLLRALGAGDAKLMLPLGMHIGYVGLPPFAFLLALFSVLMYAAIRLAALTSSTSGPIGALARMKASGRVPYAIPLCIASVPVLIIRALWLAGS